MPVSATINSSISPEQNPCGELKDPGVSPIFPNLENRDILFGGSVNCSGGGDGERSEGEFGEDAPDGRGRKGAEQTKGKGVNKISGLELKKKLFQTD